MNKTGDRFFGRSIIRISMSVSSFPWFFRSSVFLIFTLFFIDMLRRSYLGSLDGIARNDFNAGNRVIALAFWTGFNNGLSLEERSSLGRLISFSSLTSLWPLSWISSSDSILLRKLCGLFANILTNLHLGFILDNSFEKDRELHDNGGDLYSKTKYKGIFGCVGVVGRGCRG